MTECRICGNGRTEALFRGRIRDGRFGSLSAGERSILRCLNCRAAFLSGQGGQAADYYESAEYRISVDGSAEVHEYFSMHDIEQARNLSITGTSIFRGKTVTDIGCGGGSFLDAIKGYAGKAIAIEPSSIFRESLGARGYKTFNYTASALKECKGAVDLATSFSVIEHVEDPLSFLKEIHSLLAPGGKLFLSTPNTNDALLEALPDAYPAFYFRTAHLWYFDPESLAGLLRRAGFQASKIIPHQRFGLANFLAWLRDKKPQGNIKAEFVTPAVDAAWKSELERTGRSDYLYAEATA